MNIHEYQGKALLKKCGVRIQEGEMVDSPERAVEAAKRLAHATGTTCFVIKAQIHAGGRGKGQVKETGARGVVVAKDYTEVEAQAKALLGGTLVTRQTGSQGKKVNKILVAEDVYYKGNSAPHEYYVGLLLDRDTSRVVIMASSEGGVDIEEVAQRAPEKIIKEWVEPALGLQGFQARRLAFRLGLTGTAYKEMVAFTKSLYRAYKESDASLIEINPALKTADDKLLAVDAKVSLDDNALFRHKEYADWLDLSEEDPLEVEAGRAGLNYVRLNGNVGCMVNGAGLAMATMDMIKLSGGKPANFLDVGGGASPKTVEAGVRIILKDPNVRVILINIFGGIVRCDRVAQGVVDAYKSIGEIKAPIVVRLQGTNTEEGRKIIERSKLKVYPATLLQEAAQKVEELI